MRHLLAAVLGGFVAICATMHGAAADTFPNQPIKLVVPAAPGGSTDILARALAQGMQQQTGATVIVENRAGAGGAIGAGAVVNATPDGHTLLVTVPDAVTVLPHLRKDIPYDALRDLEPIGVMAETYWLFAVRADLPAKDMRELVKLAVAKPEAIRFSSPGVGTSAHLITERLALEAKAKMLHVPYKGAGPATAAVVSGEVDMIATSPISLKQFLDSGKLRGLAVTGPERIPALPGVPTLIESGFPNFSASAWFGVFAPAKLSPDLATRLHEMVTAAVNSPEFQKRLEAMGLSYRPMSRAQFASFVKTDSQRWQEVVVKSKVSITD